MDDSESFLADFIIEKMESENISIRTLAKIAGVSPTVIQKIRSKNAENINFRTFSNVLHSLGYKISIEKIKSAESGGPAGGTWANYWEYLGNFIEKNDKKTPEKNEHDH